MEVAGGTFFYPHHPQLFFFLDPPTQVLIFLLNSTLKILNLARTNIPS